MSRITVSALAAAALAAAALAAAALAGCAAQPADDDANSGKLVMQLSQPGPHGEIYHLGNAIFDVTSLATGTGATVDASADTGEVDVSVPPGLVNVSLRDGWTLEKSTDGGATFQPVSALLGTTNPSQVRILANQLTFLEFSFVIRQTNGTLGITLGVVTNPRELAGGFIVETATDGLAPYVATGRSSFDFGVFFTLVSLEKTTLDDGTKLSVYTAFGQQGAFGPLPQPTTALAAEFYNDPIGTYAGPIARDLAGGVVVYNVAAHPDGTIDFSGSLSGTITDIEFGPSVIDAVIPTLDADGFANDQFFYDTTVPFTQSSEQGTATGTMRVRHLLEMP